MHENRTTSPSSLWYVMKKYHKATFMRIAGFVWNYPCSISCSKIEHSGLVHLVKEINFWDGEWVQSIRLDSDASKGSSEEVAKALDVSLKHIDTYRSDGGRKNITWHKTDSGGGGATERLSSEIKNVGRISFLYRIVNCCMHDQFKALQQIV